MMYEELVEALRLCVKYGKAEDALANAQKAADAIEELSKLADEIPHVCECCVGCEMETGSCDTAFVLSPKRAIEYLRKPHWIPVTERLPEERKDVLVYYGFLHDGELSSQRFIGTFDYFAFDPVLHITHWMPLPEPPKEE